ncbi:MAG: thioesterase family protein [Pseudomonadota bacterium]
MTEAPWLTLYHDRVRAEWIDYNGHMSEAYYVLVFGFATDALLDHIGLGQEERVRSKSSVYTVEAHIHYLSEAGEGEPLEVRTWLLTLDAKRARVFHALHHGDDGGLLATEELMLLHVDTSGPRTAPFSPEVHARLEAMHEAQQHAPWPKQAGRAIGQAK